MEAAVDTLLVWAHVEVPLTMQPIAGGKVILVPGLVVYFAATGAFFPMKGTVDASNDNVLLMSSWTTILCKIIIMWIAFRLHISPRCLLKNVLQITYPGWCLFFFLISSTPNAAVCACVRVCYVYDTEHWRLFWFGNPHLIFQWMSKIKATGEMFSVQLTCLYYHGGWNLMTLQWPIITLGAFLFLNDSVLHYMEFGTWKIPY